MGEPSGGADSIGVLGYDRSAVATAAVLFLPTLVAAGSVDASLAGDASRAPRSLVEVGRFVTEFGTSGYMFVYSAALAAVAIIALGRDGRLRRGLSARHLAEGSVFFFAAIAASGLAAQAIKHLLGRGRPAFTASTDPFVFHPLSLANDLASFPSGHTTSAFAAAVALGLLMPRGRWWLLGCAVLIGISRVVVGAHYPSDVVGGAALGSFTAVMVARVCAQRRLAFTLDAGRVVPRRPDRG